MRNLISFGTDSRNTLTKPLMAIFCLLLLSSNPSYAKKSYTPPPQSNADFQKWLVGFKETALQKGIPQSTINTAFANVKLNKRVLELDRRQPEFTQTFWQYYQRAVTSWRMKQGTKLLKKHKPLLSEVTKKYGIPERILVSFWGMETNFGGYTGNTPIIESLATLSYDQRRSRFFSKELIAALQILANGDVPSSRMKGSWAGAMGQCQFMPSNYLKYAVDADGDNRRDLWRSHRDIFHSMGNFLKILGWKKGENWGREVQLPKGFDFAIADGKSKRSLAEWQDLGLKLADGRTLPQEDMKAALLLPYDASGPAFLVFDNFFVIKRWNNSNNYALAVGTLADRIVGRDQLSKKAPKNDKALSREQMKEIQLHLKMHGYEVGKIDGIAGSKTKQALRNYQVKKGIPADGYPSYRMLTKLRSDKL